MDAATILAQLDRFSDAATGALVPPLQLGVTSRFAAGEDAAGAYARSGNEAGRLLERVMAALEGGAASTSFGSATAAAQAILATLRPGDHVLFDSGAYYEFAEIFGAFGARWGVTVDRVDATDLPAVRAALRAGRTRLVWTECPSNPLWRVPDIAGLSALTRAAGARLLVDATVATPVLCRPLALGADWVLHSATKYLNGHGDLLAGVLTGRAEDEGWDALIGARMTHGSVLPPFEAWLLLRGMRTLAVRMERVCASALRIASWLAERPGVVRVHYPGLAGSRWHDAARRQFTGGFGGMVSFEMASATAAKAVVAGLRLFRRATSLGSTESLAEHRSTTEGPASACPPGLVRLSVGLEDAGALIEDLDGAIGGAGHAVDR